MGSIVEGMMGTRLSREFFERDVLTVAPELVGKVLRVKSNKEDGTSRGIITEVEAYRGEEDGACHARFGRTRRTEVMYGKGGLVYVYLIYGMYWMLNIVTGELNQPQAVLIRGIRIIQNLKIKKEKRLSLKERVGGPGRVGRWLQLDDSFYGEDVTSSQRIWFEESGFKIQESRIIQTERIGVEYAGEWARKKWRWLAE